MRRLLLTCLLLMTATAAMARDYWEFPNVTVLPNTAEFLVYDPTIPAGDVDRRSRNITWQSLQALIAPDWSSILNKPATYPPAAHTQAATSITGLAPVATSGSYGDLSNTPTIPSAATQIAYASGTVADALNQLLYVAPGSPSVSGGGTYEIGSTISSVALNWSIALGGLPLTSQSVNNGIGAIDTALRTYTHSGQTITTDTTYTVSISDGTSSRSGSTSLLFRYRRFWGVSSAASLTDTAIKALSSELASSRSQTRTMTASGQYLYFCWPDAWGVPAWTVNGLPNTDFQLVRQDTFVNAAGYSYTIRLYRSGNLLTGTYTVVVS